MGMFWNNVKIALRNLRKQVKMAAEKNLYQDFIKKADAFLTSSHETVNSTPASSAD